VRARFCASMKCIDTLLPAKTGMKSGQANRTLPLIHPCAAWLPDTYADSEVTAFRM
jgi:hypothetical protein